MMKTTGVQKSGYVHGGGRGEEADTADRRVRPHLTHSLLQPTNASTPAWAKIFNRIRDFMSDLQF